MSPQSVGLWFHNRLYAGGKKIATYFPVKNGAKKLVYDPTAPSEEYWEYDPTRGWIGGVAEDGTGLGARTQVLKLLPEYISTVHDMAKKHKARLVRTHDLFQKHL